MPKISLRNMSGESVGEMELTAGVFETAPSVPLMHQAVVSEMANRRLGTSNTLKRGEVSGGGRKPFRQKGTGRARQGSIRSPLMYHGGVAFGPHPRSYSKSMPRKMRRAAVKSALSARLADDAIIVVEELKLEKISTKAMLGLLKGVGACGKTLVVVDEVTEVISKSVRNIPDIELRISPSISVRDILNAEKIIMTRGAVEKLQEVLGA